jgi:hypothetical protein
VSGHHPSSSFLRKRKRRFKSRADKEKKEACGPAIRTLCLFKVFCCLSGNPVTQVRDPLRIQHSCKSYQRPFVRYLSKEPTTSNLFFNFTYTLLVSGAARSRKIRYLTVGGQEFKPSQNSIPPRSVAGYLSRFLPPPLSLSLSSRTYQQRIFFFFNNPDFLCFIFAFPCFQCSLVFSLQ